MTGVKVELAPRYGTLDVGDVVAGAFSIRYTNDHGPMATIDVPDSWTDAEIDVEMRRLLQHGYIVQGGANDGQALWRRVKGGWVPLWIPPNPIQANQLMALYSAGDTYPLMGIDEATMRLGHHGEGVRVGHVDTWVDVAHPWLAATEMAVGGQGKDGESHGTHTAATMVGLFGILTDAALITFNALPNGSGTEELVAQGIDWVTDRDVDFISLSLGGGGASRLIGQSVERAKARGVPVCAAAGNSGGAATTPGSPAREATWQVMACDRNLRAASFTDGRNWSTPNRIYGQGVNVVSAFPNGSQGPASGTSMACPHVAAAIGLLKRGGVTAFGE